MLSFYHVTNNGITSACAEKRAGSRLRLVV